LAQPPAPELPPTRLADILVLVLADEIDVRATAPGLGDVQDERRGAVDLIWPDALESDERHLVLRLAVDLLSAALGPLGQPGRPDDLAAADEQHCVVGAQGGDVVPALVVEQPRVLRDQRLDREPVVDRKPVGHGRDLSVPSDQATVNLADAAGPVRRLCFLVRA
jgi:hypothetical protein